MSAAPKWSICCMPTRKRYAALVPTARSDHAERPPGGLPMFIEIIPSGAALGAEISGVDLAQPLDDAAFAAIERAQNDHGVTLFRDQQITPPHRLPSPAALGRPNSTYWRTFGACRVAPRSSWFPMSRGWPPDRRPTLARNGTVTCAMQLAHRAGPCPTRSRFPACTA
jgi:Taurine catabolism dioxygenase TauD, TfdA family